LDVGPGRVTLPMARVERVVSSPSLLARYRERAGRLATDDLKGWLELAAWASQGGLLTQAREAYGHALAIDGSHAEAHAGPGPVRQDGGWMTADESFRARGFVQFEGAWLSAQERDAILQGRSEAASAERARLESEARVREADARARAAEADARRAESA